MMSASTLSFCLQGRSMVVCGESLCGCHGLQDLQVSMMSGIQLIVLSSMPPAFKMFSSGVLGACHHLKCSLRNSFRLCSSVPVFRTRRLLSMLNLVQSDGELSVPGANSLTTGPRGTPTSLRCARSPPGVPEAGLRGGCPWCMDPGSRDDADGVVA